MNIKQETIQLIDELKATCQTYGMGNDGNEYKIITQVFLYKYINDKFCYELKKFSPKLQSAERLESNYATYSEDEIEDLFDAISVDVPKLRPEHLIANLWNQQRKGDFDLIFDRTMVDIADKNVEIFGTKTTQNTSIPLFEPLTPFVTDIAQRAPFARALVDKLVKFSFEEAFHEHYDFFAYIFEYLIKDYNTNGGGKYAEYYTPHAIATIMAKLLVGNKKGLHSIECYDPSAGTGTLLMALAHEIGEDKCTIFSQDISQRSNKMLKLNLILNNLVSSLDNAIQGDTLMSPYHKNTKGDKLKQFDFIVSNPPFKMDFSDTRAALHNMPARFWAGVPNVPKNKKESMSIYTLFIQHVINSLKENSGKGSIVVPTGFLTAKSSIEKNIRTKLVSKKWLAGVVSMPSNIFATTGTNVSVLFIDKSATFNDAILVDASKLGQKVKDGKNQKTLLRQFEIDNIITAFTERKTVDELSVLVSYHDIEEKGYSFSAGHYFSVKIEHVDISEEEFNNTIDNYIKNLSFLFNKGKIYEENILSQLKGLSYE